MKREYLVHKLVCSECGGLLELSYEPPPRAERYCHGEPTGAAMIQQIVAVVPCPKCREPAAKVLGAVDTLLSALEEQRWREAAKVRARARDGQKGGTPGFRP